MDSDILKIRFTNTYMVRDKKPYTVSTPSQIRSSPAQERIYSRLPLAFRGLHASNSRIRAAFER